MKQVLDTKAAVVVTENTGYLLQMQGEIDRIDHKDDMKGVILKAYYWN